MRRHRSKLKHDIQREWRLFKIRVAPAVPYVRTVIVAIWALAVWFHLLQIHRILERAYD